MSKSKKPVKKSGTVVKVAKTRKSNVLNLQPIREEMAEIDARRAKLQAILDACENLNVPGKAKVGRKVGSTRKGKPTLRTYFENVLAKNKKGITIAKACDAVIEGGYETNSGNFMPVLQQLVHKMMKDDELVVVGQDGRKNLYAKAA